MDEAGKISTTRDKWQKAENIKLRYEDLPDFLTVKELSKYLRVGANRAYTLANRKDFPSCQFGNRKVFPKKQVKAWVERHL
jgi:excisionase family DNA binding protein